MIQDYSIIIITHNIEIVDEIINELNPLNVKIFNGNGFDSFSKVINNACMLSDTDQIILVNYKARPKKEHIYKIINLLNEGYGFVGLYRFGFFGFNKNLIKKIGYFDERFLGGGYEDCDFLRRLIEYDIAYYESE